MGEDKPNRRRKSTRLNWQRKSATATAPHEAPPALHSALLWAIEGKRLVRFKMPNEPWRNAEPHIYGRSAGEPSLLVFVPDVRDEPWRLLRLADVDDLKVLEDERFPGRRALPAKYDPDKQRVRPTLGS